MKTGSAATTGRVMRRYRRSFWMAMLALGFLLPEAVRPNAVALGQAQDAAQPGAPASPPEDAAHAASPVASPEPPEGSQYRALVEAALEEFSRGKWTEAYALFVQAHALEPSARTLRGLAACAFEARQYLRAIETMRAALSDPRKPLSEDQRLEGASLIERAQLFVARLTLVIEPATAGVEVDAVAATFDDQARVLLDPGVHQITVHHPGHLTETRSVQVSPGDALQLSVQLAPARTVPGAGPEVGAEPNATPAAPRPEAAVPTRTWAWLTAGLGVALAGTGVALFALGQSGVSDVEHACPKGACSRDEIDRHIDSEHLRELQSGSILAFALAGASAVVSTVLFASSADSDEATLSATARGGVLQARF